WTPGHVGLLPTYNGNRAKVAELSLSGWTNGFGSVPAAGGSVRQRPIRGPRVALAPCDLRFRRALQRRQDNLLEQRQERARGRGRQNHGARLRAGRGAARLTLFMQPPKVFRTPKYG